MTETQTKGVTKAELEQSRSSALVHDISMQTSKKDLENLIKRQIGLPIPVIDFGRSYEVNGEKRQKAYLNFKNKERVNELMKSGSLIHHGQKMKISRYTPKKCHMSGYISSTVSLTIYETEEDNRFKKELTEHDLEQYFRQFGEIIACDWQSSNEVMLQFRDYDSVDQIILYDVSHTINGIKVDVEKAVTKKKTADSASDARRYCIHLTNMPYDVTSDELSIISSVGVADILLQPANQLSAHLASNDFSMSEAWIKHISDQRLAQDFAKKHTQMKIRRFLIHCAAVEEPVSTSELCRDFEMGSCKYPSDRCNYKHIICSEPDECENRECWYGHSKKRSTTSNKRPIEDSEQSACRVRIGNLPSTITKEQLMNRLDIPPKYLGRLKFPDQTVSNEPMVAYLVNQPSENLLRQKIREWHNSPFSKDIPTKMKCQLERNMHYFDWDDHSDSSEIVSQSLASSSASNTINNIPSTTTKLAPWYTGKKDMLSTTIQTEQSNGTNSKLAETNNSPNIKRKKAMKGYDSGPSNLAALAPQWRWTNEKLSSDSSSTADVYLLVDKTDKELNAAIKIYRTKLNSAAQQDAKHEKLILDKLKGLDGIPKLITSSIDIQSTIESNNDPWIIVEHIKGVTLHEFIRTNNSMSFRDKLIITLKLLQIVNGVHSRNIVHRHINPEKIIIRTQFDTENHHHPHDSDEINLVLIGFSQACLTQDEDDRNHIQDTFYQPPQFERHSPTDSDNESSKRKNILCSPNIDTSYICAILFWLITKCEPRESRNIHGEAPHQRKTHTHTIDEELTKATGVWTKTENRLPLKEHLKLIFERGFAAPDQQWPIEELAYQLQHIVQLATRNNEEKNCFSPPLSKKQIESSLNTSKPDSFLQLASFIDLMKRQFSIRYPDVHWSTDNKSRWFHNNQQVQNTDFLTFEKQQKSIVIETLCCAEINKNQELMITIMAKINQTNKVTLPLGVWKQYEQETIKEEILKTFELELKILIDIFYKNKIM